MKPIFYLSILCLTLFSFSAQAQKPDSVTTEELTKYVVMMDSVETLKNNLANVSTKYSKGNAKITADRYNKLLPMANDDKKLTEAKATPDEIAYVKKAIAERNQETQKFQDTFTSLMNTYVGYDTFNKVRKAIAADATVKARYDAEMKKRSGKP
jgi:hypothetical protein